LLDEPTNHLDLPGIEWLERELAGMRSGIVLISHDRRLLERISRTTIWLDRGIIRSLNEGFKAFEPWRDAMLEQEAGEQHKLGRKIAMEEDWLRYASPHGAPATRGGSPSCTRGAGQMERD
jgi:ABC transport system ATP-binding/permease protein